MTVRKIFESPLHQGVDERVAYTLTTTPWGSSPSSVDVKLFLLTATTDAKTDVSTTNLSGSVATLGDVITTPLVISLLAGRDYRMEIKFTISGNVFEAWAIIKGEE